MIEVMREARIAAPAEQVWAVVSDAARAADWFAFSERTDVREGEGVGQLRTQHGRWGRKRSEVDQEITAFEPAKLLVWRHLAERLDGKPAPRFAASTEFRIELDEEEDATVVRLRSRQEPASPFKGWVMKRLGTKDIARNLDISLVRLASAVAN